MTAETAATAITMPETHGSAVSSGFGFFVSEVASGIRELFGAPSGAVSSPGRAAELETRFNALANQWHEETGGLSNPSHITRNPNYLSIIGLREPALRFIFRDMAQRGGYWYPALRMITGVSPTTREARGKHSLLDQQWFTWARENGYLD